MALPRRLCYIAPSARGAGSRLAGIAVMQTQTEACSMKFTDILYSKSDSIARIIINRPEVYKRHQG